MTMPTNMPIRVMTFLLLSAVSAATAVAHHSTNLDYDVAKFITVKGRVVEADWINPHAILKFDVVNAKGVTEHWMAETHGAATLAHFGWRKDYFKPGTEITVWGNPARREGRPLMHMLKVTLPGGKELTVNKDNY